LGTPILQCRFIIAEKSWHRPIIGDLAKAIKCIPVARAQDNAKAGQGKVSGTTGEKVIKGDGCNFTAVFAAKDSIKAGSAQYRVEAVDDDNTLRLMDALTESLADVPYKILKRIDQDVVYRRVYDLFQDGGVLGIFPEGGSHDRTEMLELKPGVCIMALGAMQMHPELDVKIVPCGLNYMAGHKFRSKVVIQFGPPIEIPRTLVEQYATDKRGAVAALLHQVQRSMKDVVVEAPDYDALTMIHTMRRLYTPLGRKLDPKEYHILNKRLSTIYYEHGALDGFDTLLGDLRAYRELIADYSLSDSQVARMQLAALVCHATSRACHSAYARPAPPRPAMPCHTNGSRMSSLTPLLPPASAAASATRRWCSQSGCRC
jgi:glycerol-3-phosphate O-acyltransferase/dihydroxyacetone phosphate acyltransferase